MANELGQMNRMHIDSHREGSLSMSRTSCVLRPWETGRAMSNQISGFFVVAHASVGGDECKFRDWQCLR